MGKPPPPAPPRPLLLQLVCLPAPTSFLCIFLFQLLLDTCPSRIGGSCPTLLPKTLGNGSKHHGSKLYPGRAPGLEFVSGNPPEWVGLHSALPSPAPTPPPVGMLFLLTSQSWDSLEDGPEHLGSSLQAHCNLLKALAVPNSHLKTKILSDWLFTISLNGPQFLKHKSAG